MLTWALSILFVTYWLVAYRVLGIYRSCAPWKVMIGPWKVLIGAWCTQIGQFVDKLFKKCSSQLGQSLSTYIRTFLYAKWMVPFLKRETWKVNVPSLTWLVTWTLSHWTVNRSAKNNNVRVRKCSLYLVCRYDKLFWLDIMASYGSSNLICHAKIPLWEQTWVWVVIPDPSYCRGWHVISRLEISMVHN